MPLRYICIKLLEGDKGSRKADCQFSKYNQIIARRDKERNYVETSQEDTESSYQCKIWIYGREELKETLDEKPNKIDKSKLIDSIVTNKYIGFPVFFLFLWIMFEATFRLGNYPMEWIESIVGWIGNLVRSSMSPGPLKDLIVDGIIRCGRSNSISPNIVILYLFIAFMEDSATCHAQPL